MPPEHIAAGVKVELRAGAGLMLTTTFSVLLQPFNVVITRYVTFTGLAVVLVKISEIEAVEPDPARLEMPITAALVHENVEPARLLVIV